MQVEPSQEQSQGEPLQSKKETANKLPQFVDRFVLEYGARDFSFIELEELDDNRT